MSKCGASEDGTQEKPEFSLTKAVEDVSQHGFAQSEALKEKQKTLRSLQAALSDVEKKAETAEQELRSKTREVVILEAEMENLQQQNKILQDRCASTTRENTELQTAIREEEEEFQIVLGEWDTYRKKMKNHREAVLHSVSQTEAHQVLEEKREQVRKLMEKKEELKEDLKNPYGNTAQVAKREIEVLKEEISVMRRTTAKRREQLQKEFETQNLLKKDIEIQNKRYEAIVKRLHCQLSRAQAGHIQMSEDIYHMERQLAELKTQLESSHEFRFSGSADDLQGDIPSAG
ncbi:coiled-coil domain-containing protein 122 [Antennarius striatus]|uniref:coiled-coil domain-containing protein 122 n=1 Tax=Antennarius striatus TaxID=241820 RepID=UPI0035B4C4C9